MRKSNESWRSKNGERKSGSIFKNSCQVFQIRLDTRFSQNSDVETFVLLNVHILNNYAHPNGEHMRRVLRIRLSPFSKNHPKK